jgi:hypothetical protein
MVVNDREMRWTWTKQRKRGMQSAGQLVPGRRQNIAWQQKSGTVGVGAGHRLHDLQDLVVLTARPCGADIPKQIVATDPQRRRYANFHRANPSVVRLFNRKLCLQAEKLLIGHAP